MAFMQQSLSNDSMKLSKLKDYLTRCHPAKPDRDLKYFQTVKNKLREFPRWTDCSLRCYKDTMMGYGVFCYFTTYSKFRKTAYYRKLLNFARFWRSFKNNSTQACFSKNNRVHRRNAEMSYDIEHFLCKQPISL